MKHRVSFVGGMVSGVAVALFVGSLGMVAPAEAPSQWQAPTAVQGARADDPIASSWHTAAHPQALPSAQAPKAAAGTVPTLQVDSLLNQLAAQPDHVFDSSSSLALSCWMRQDRQVAAQVRNRLLNSHSHTERHGLIRVLAQDDNPETMQLVAQLISSQDGEAKRLGFDLLRGLDGSTVRPELSRALLAATQQESNPDYLAELIASLSHQRLDEAAKGVMVQQLQSILAHSQHPTRASALMGLAQFADAPTLALSVKRHLHDPDADVRLAAVNAALQMNSRSFDAEIMSAVHSLSLSPEEPAAVRNLAMALLRRNQPQDAP